MLKNITNEHAKMVKVLAKSGKKIVEEMTPLNAHLLHMAVGVAGEAGELLDVIKKIAIYNQPIDLNKELNIVEELGDLEFYMEGLRKSLGIKRTETLKANMEKLAVRYENYRYSDAQAKERKDKH